MNVVIIKDSLGRVQFKMAVEAPKSRIEKELLPVLERGAAVAGWAWDVVVEHVQEGGFAAIGSDGTRPVVWGVGENEDDALQDARGEIHERCEAEGEDIDLRVVAVSPEQMGRIAAGEVSAQSLGLA